MNRLTSSDGTTIAFERSGDGPPVILVCGGSTDRTANAPLADLLAEQFTVFITTVGVEATAGTRHPMRSSARSRTSMPLSPRPVDRRLCMALPPVRRWTSRQRQAA
jgi:hypothetical protein